ncbi:hypothetical protein [Desulfovermiculus halophilus]|jgi:tRNA nucleotidyltransferase (CCA-adding enzyme)|uniref:hypothetical protein n=1 Tax=Desulfovermiculus halophilus TaxID=339722 RepID=UPI00054F059F|nr:hypothetical protein [Desulfovermiculus halophilus]
MHIYCVGGAVRDAFLGRPVLDTDYVVVGCREEEFARTYPRARKVGQSHPVFLLRGRQYTVSAAQNIDQDLLGRDLTVNALALDQSGYLYTHPLAVSDLAHRWLRPVRAENFFADPLRVIRAARFKACLPEFRPAPELLSLMTRVASAGMLDRIAPERVGREVRLACGGSKPGNFLRLLACTTCLHPWLNELLRADRKRSARIMDRLAGRELRVWMALVHSLEDASARTAGCVPDSMSAERAGALGRRLRLPNTMTAAGRLAAAWSQTAAHYDRLAPEHRVALLLDLQAQGLMEDFWSLIRAVHGHDHFSRAQADLRTIRGVRLPPEWRNLGRRSGEYLHYLRCRSLQP